MYQTRTRTGFSAGRILSASEAAILPTLLSDSPTQYRFTEHRFRKAQTPTANSLFSPAGIAVDQRSGDLYVADSGNNRVLRYPKPVSQFGRVIAAVVLDQMDFTSATSAAVNASSLRTPSAVTLGPDGNIFVADSGNSRILEFPAQAATGSPAIRVYGQPNMFTATTPAQLSAQTLTGPQGVFVDPASNLYVADTGANRVVIFPNTQAAPLAGQAAAFVIGQNSFRTATGTTMRTPADVFLDSAANTYVADFGNNRILSFPSIVFLAVAGGSPTSVIGQRDATSTIPNWNATGNGTTAEGISGPSGILNRRIHERYQSAQSHYPP
jgi:sugar lactone lactonase YvrE